MSKLKSMVQPNNSECSGASIGNMCETGNRKKTKRKKIPLIQYFCIFLYIFVFFVYMHTPPKKW